MESKSDLQSSGPIRYTIPDRCATVGSRDYPNKAVGLTKAQCSEVTTQYNGYRLLARISVVYVECVGSVTRRASMVLNRPWSD